MCDDSGKYKEDVDEVVAVHWDGYRKGYSHIRLQSFHLEEELVQFFLRVGVLGLRFL